MYMSTLRRLSKALRPKVNVDGEIKMKRAFSQLFSRFLKWLTQGVEKSAKAAGACPT